MNIDDNLYRQFLTPEKKKGYNGLRAKPPKRVYYCARCKQGFEKATTRSPVLHSKHCDTQCVLMGMGEDGWRRVRELQNNRADVRRR